MTIMRTYKLVCLERNGISKETVSEAMKVLKVIEETTLGLYFDLIKFPIGVEYCNVTGGG